MEISDDFVSQWHLRLEYKFIPHTILWFHNILTKKQLIMASFKMQILYPRKTTHFLNCLIKSHITFYTHSLDE